MLHFLRETCCQESKPHICQQRTWCKNNVDTYNLFPFLSVSSVKAKQKRERQITVFCFFWWEPSWLHHSSSMDITFLSYEQPSLGLHTPAPSLQLLMWSHHKLRSDVGLCIAGVEPPGTAERKATGKFVLRTRAQERVSVTDRWRQARERDWKWADVSQREGGWRDDRGWGSGRRTDTG